MALAETPQREIATAVRPAFRGRRRPLRREPGPRWSAWPSISRILSRALSVGSSSKHSSA